MTNILTKLLSLVSRGGVILALSATISKLLGFLRDRLTVNTFSTENADIVFMAFRIPDFFFYTFVGMTLALLFVPRVLSVKNTQEQHYFFSSLLWKTSILFGVICLLGAIFTDFFTALIGAGLAESNQLQVTELARWLFLSVFLLAISSVFSAYLQARKQFISLALAPILYVSMITGGIYIGGASIGINVIGYSAILGSLLHMLVNIFAFFMKGGAITLTWHRPRALWKGFLPDFLYRGLNNILFQLNQSIDIFIAGFLITGSIVAFSLGLSLGQVLVSIIGYSIASSVFPRMSNNAGNPQKQKKILLQSIGWVLFFTIPVSVFGAFFSRPILEFLFGMQGTLLELTHIVFFWTVLSLPFGTLCPIFSRYFLAHSYVKTTFFLNLFSLSIATSIAIYISLFLLKGETYAILGLGVGNFIANTLSMVLMGVGIIWIMKQQHKKL